MDQNIESLVKLYRHFHQHPELSLQEHETAARVAAELKTAGYEVTSGVGGTGVVAILKNGAGPTLMLRTDLDALPVTEQTGLAYASTVKTKIAAGETGVMHACGHDIHMTNLIGTGRYLAEHKRLWQGTLMLIAQPAEERGAGARAMLADGLFKRFPKPDLALALHVDSTLEAGRVGYLAGPANANVDSVDIVIHGRGGHGARPEACIDPIVIAAKLVIDLQTIVSREIEPTQPAVVTVGSIHGGTQHNIIGESCKLQLTVRSYTDVMRKHLLESIERKTKAAAASAGAPDPEIVVAPDGTPALINDKTLVDRLVPVFEQTIGKENVVHREPTMGGEDFSEYQRAGVPIFMYRLGTIDAQRLAGFARLKQDPPSLHSPLYYPDAELSLVTGIRLTSAAAIELLKPTK